MLHGTKKLFFIVLYLFSTCFVRHKGRSSTHPLGCYCSCDIVWFAVAVDCMRASHNVPFWVKRVVALKWVWVTCGLEAQVLNCRIKMRETQETVLKSIEQNSKLLFPHKLCKCLKSVFSKPVRSRSSNQQETVCFIQANCHNPLMVTPFPWGWIKYLRQLTLPSPWIASRYAPLGVGWCQTSLRWCH